MKFRRLTALLICIISVVALFTSCKKNEVKAFYFAVGEPALTFDPTIAESGTAKIIVRNCFEGLVYSAGNGKIEPGAAESWTVSPDGRVYTFKLRENAKWHITSNAKKELEGKLPKDFDLSLTAEDFVFGFTRGVNPAMGAKDSYLLKSIAGAEEILSGKASPEALGVKALSKYVLEITLSHPDGDFLSVLGEPICMPCNRVFFEACGGRYGLLIRNSLSNGPFYLSFFDETSYRISKNPDYVGEHTPKADVIRLYSVTDSKTLLTKMKAGDYSGAYMSEAQLSELGASKKMQTLSTADITRCFILNLKSEALSEPGFRTAFLYGTDVDSLCKYAEKQPVYSPLPLGISQESPRTKALYDPKKAVSELSAALETAKEKSHTVTLKCERKYETFIKKQLQNWQQLFGTDYVLNIEVLSEAELQTAVKKGSFDIAFYPVATPSATSLDFFSMFMSDSQNNLCGVENEELDRAIKELSAANKGQTAAIQKIVSLLEANGVLLPVWSESSYFVCSRQTKGIVLLPGKDNIYFHSCTDE